MKITFTQYDLACMLGLDELPEMDNCDEYTTHAFEFHGIPLFELENYNDDDEDNVYTRVGRRVMDLVGKAAAKMMVEDNK